MFITVVRKVKNLPTFEDLSLTVKSNATFKQI